MTKSKSKAKAGRKSGGMGGPGGGPLHDIGSAQSGMTGGSGMGGNDPANRQGGELPELADIDLGFDPQAANPGAQQSAEVQQSAQREGMGGHRHSSRTNEQALDASIDVDDLGNHVRAAADSRADKKSR